MRKLFRYVAIVISLCGITATQLTLAGATTTQLGSLTIITVPLDQHTITVKPPVSNSPGLWSLTLDNSSLATIKGLTLTLIGVGAGQLTFTPAASGSYGSASRTTVFRVTPGTPTLGVWAPLTVPLTANQFKVLPPTSNSSGTWIYSLANNIANGYPIATLNGNVVTLLDGGTVTINATQLATNTFLQTSVQNTLAITALKPVLGPFEDASFSGGSVTSLNFKLPTSTSPGAWTLSSSEPSVATVVGTVVTLVRLGKTVITARQGPANGYQSASASMNLSFLPALPTPSPTLSPTPSPTPTPKPTATPTPSPTLGPTPKPTPKPTATPTPSPTLSPTPKPTPKPTPSTTKTQTPSPRKTPVVPIVFAKVVGQTIYVTSNNPKVVVMINGAPAKIGVNKVRAGANLIIIEFDAKVIYSRVFTTK